MHARGCHGAMVVLGTTLSESGGTWLAGMAACCGFNLVEGNDDVANKIDDLKVLGDIK